MKLDPTRYDLMIFKSVATLSLLLIFLTSLTSSGQEIDRHPKEAYFDVGANLNSYIKEWLILGPFPKGEAFEANASPLHNYGGEANIRPYEGMKITAPDGKTHTWKRYKSQADIINLIDAIGEHEDVVAYAACNIINVGAKHSQNASPLNDSPLEMLIGSDDGVKVWLNGKLIHSNPVERGITLDEDRLPVKLVKGINPCLIKVDQGSSNWGFALRLIDYQGYLQSINQSLKLELSVRGQKPKLETGTGTEGVWKTYRFVDGLASNSVHTIIQDKKGAIWVGTTEGVSMFDGRRWRTMTLSLIR